jgi:hypothetical protein
MLGHAVTRPMRVVVLSAVMLSTIGCGSGLFAKAETAMTGCVAVRNPLFKAGRAEQALALPLPAAVETLATETAYNFGFKVYQEAAKAAETQAELTCALELGSHYVDEDVREWLTGFLGSPNPPVAAHAKRLLEKQLEKLGRVAPR